MISKFLFKVLSMSEKADFIVNVLTDWPAIKVGAYVAISAAVLSAIGTVAGVYFGIKLSLKSFYTQKWWEKKADSYLDILNTLSNLSFKYTELKARFYASADSDIDICNTNEIQELVNESILIAAKLSLQHGQLTSERTRRSVYIMFHNVPVRTQEDALHDYDERIFKTRGIVLAEMKKDLNID